MLTLTHNTRIHSLCVGAGLAAGPSPHPLRGLRTGTRAYVGFVPRRVRPLWPRCWPLTSPPPSQVHRHFNFSPPYVLIWLCLLKIGVGSPTGRYAEGLFGIFYF